METLPSSGSSSFLLNEVDWLTMALLGLARQLELPADKTLKELPGHVTKIMDELHNLRANRH